MLTQATQTPAPRLVAKVLRDLLVAERFTCYADLLDTLKFRLAKLRLRVTPDDIAEGVRLVESNRPLLVADPAPVTRPLREAPPAYEPIGRAEAAAFYAELLKRAAREKVPA